MRGKPHTQIAGSKHGSMRRDAGQEGVRRPCSRMRGREETRQPQDGRTGRGKSRAASTEYGVGHRTMRHCTTSCTETNHLQRNQRVESRGHARHAWCSRRRDRCWRTRTTRQVMRTASGKRRSMIRHDTASISVFNGSHAMTREDKQETHEIYLRTRRAGREAQQAPSTHEGRTCPSDGCKTACTT